MNKQKFYIPSLDGIRSVAFCLVFFSHAGYGNIIPGGFGVTIFFFLSGYLITTLLRREHYKLKSISLKKFYLRRILRIWPPFYFVLLFGVLLTILGILKGTIEVQPFLAQALHITNYYQIFFDNFEIAVGSGVFWSLAVEEHFYLIFPFLYILLLRMRIIRQNQAIIFWILCLLVLAWRCFLVFKIGVTSNRTYYASDTRLDSMLFGCALAVYGNPVLDPQPERLEWVLKYILLPLSTALILFSLL